MTVHEKRPDAQAGVTRRVLLIGAGATLGCAACGGGGASAAAVPTTGGAVRLPLSTFPALARPGGQAVIDAGEETILVLRDDQGGARALSMRCTHQGCQVAWKDDVGELRCPCHGSRFSATGEVVEGPAKRPLASFPAVIEGDEVVVTLGTGDAT